MATVGFPLRNLLLVGFTCATLAWIPQSSLAPRSKVWSLQATTESLKAEILTLGATLDRGQAYNPTSGEYYSDRIDIAKEKIDDFVKGHPNNVPRTMADVEGEWVSRSSMLMKRKLNFKL